MSYKILVVDDEEKIVNLLKDFFEMQHYIVFTALSGKESFEMIDKKPDIILLDINMPEMNGLEVCKKIRNFISCPIIFLTAKVEKQDRINGLMVGGDDYILKPFSIDELSARVMAHLRREERKSNNKNVHFSNDFVISYSEKTVFYNNEEIPFTKTEFEIIEILSINKGQIFTKEKIYEKIWGFDKDGDSSIITEHIRRIRLKFSKYSSENMIETVWGVGYKWIA